MSKVCKECGHQMNDNAQVCPNCGCPVKSKSVADSMDKAVLSQGKSTEAEATVTEVAETVLKWGKLLSIFVPVGLALVGIGMGASEGNAGGTLYTILYAVLLFFVIRLIAKVIWGVIMLFVNISTTLKRIEILLEKNGTR